LSQYVLCSSAASSSCSGNFTSTCHLEQVLYRRGYLVRNAYLALTSHAEEVSSVKNTLCDRCAKSATSSSMTSTICVDNMISRWLLLILVHGECATKRACFSIYIFAFVALLQSPVPWSSQCCRPKQHEIRRCANNTVCSIDKWFHAVSQACYMLMFLMLFVPSLRCCGR
jgi:hypothetical protein